MAAVRIAVVSEFRPDSDVGLDSTYARAFGALGHDVSRHGLHALRGEHVRFPSAAMMAAQAGLRDAVSALSPPLVVIVKGVGVMARTVEAWQRNGARVVNVFPDNPGEAVGAAPIGRTLPGQLKRLDRVFVHDRFAVGQLRRAGIRAEFMAFARDHEIHDPEFAGPRPPDHPEIVFVGNPDEERIRYLRAIADLPLGLWGRWSWARLPPGDPLAACIRGSVGNGKPMVSLLAHATLAINVMRRSQKTAHNMRTFENPACGACALSESTNAVLELMQDGVEVATFSTPEELRRVAIGLLGNDKRRRAIAEAGWQRVRSDTYQVRARKIIDAVG
ncbi:MAG: glycosyltransferase [Pseudomonadota bacterium]|nr:glycosyltransferase [Pseudomonadota bacterium]